jgi:hypothetical protein
MHWMAETDEWNAREWDVREDGATAEAALKAALEAAPLSGGGGRRRPPP